MKKISITIIALLIAFGAFAQKEVTLTIKHMLGSSPFAFNQAAMNDLNNNFSITRVDYYISGIKIIHDGAQETTVPAKYILVKGDQNHVAFLGTFNVTNVEGIKFSIGVDAATNTTTDPSGATTPYPLNNQSPSMHWGWTSGYRFVALEGNAGSSLSTLYQLHGLFDPNYFEQTVMAAGVNNGNSVTINLDADYTQAVKGIDLIAGPINHGDNTNDLTMLQNFRDFVFSPGTGIPLTLANPEVVNQIKFFPNPSTGQVRFLVTNKMAGLTDAIVYDLSGKKIKEISLVGKTTADFIIENKGMYIIRLNSYGIQVGSSSLLIQ